MKLVDVLPPHVASVVPAQWQSLPVAHVAHDSRRCREHTLFAAWQGKHADGHAFIEAARKQGAVFVLSERPLPGDVPHLVVPNPRRLLSLAAARLYANDTQALSLVGLTGTNGKTTCAHLVASVLASAGTSAVAIGTLGESRIDAEGHIDMHAVPGTLTTPEAADVQWLLAQAAKRGARGAAIEATSIALAQGRIEGLLFDVCAMTNLTQDHLDVHGTMQAYGAAKALLFSHHAKTNCVFVLNAHDPFQRQLPHKGRPTLFYGTQSRMEGIAVDVVAKEVHLLRDGMRLTIETPRGSLHVRSCLVGDFNVENILLTAAVGIALRLDTTVIERGIGALRAVPGRLERFGGDDAMPLVLVDYAHTPDALERSLQVSRTLTPTGRLICVFGCGGDRDAKKRPLMGEIANRLADLVFVTNDNPRTESPDKIADDIFSGMAPHRAVITRELDRARAIDAAVALASAKDTVLIAGKGHESYQLMGTVSHPFDDREQVRSALRGRTTR